MHTLRNGLAPDTTPHTTHMCNNSDAQTLQQHARIHTPGHTAVAHLAVPARNSPVPADAPDPPPQPTHRAMPTRSDPELAATSNYQPSQGERDRAIEERKILNIIMQWSTDLASAKIFHARHCSGASGAALTLICLRANRQRDRPARRTRPNKQHIHLLRSLLAAHRLPTTPDTCSHILGQHQQRASKRRSQRQQAARRAPPQPSGKSARWAGLSNPDPENAPSKGQTPSTPHSINSKVMHNNPTSAPRGGPPPDRDGPLALPTNWGEPAPPNTPFHEKQTRQFCQIHAINNSTGGHPLIDPWSVMAHSNALNENLKRLTGGSQKLDGAMYNSSGGNFDVSLINHYLTKSNDISANTGPGLGFHLAHTPQPGYAPGPLAHVSQDTKSQLQELKGAVHNNRVEESYGMGILPGSTQTQILARLPPQATSAILHNIKFHPCGQYGHATCIRKWQDEWWHIDSEEPHPQLLTNGDNDPHSSPPTLNWGMLYGKIYTLKTGPATIALVLRHADGSAPITQLEADYPPPPGSPLEAITKAPPPAHAKVAPRGNRQTKTTHDARGKLKTHPTIPTLSPTPARHGNKRPATLPAWPTRSHPPLTNLQPSATNTAPPPAHFAACSRNCAIAPQTADKAQNLHAAPPIPTRRPTHALPAKNKPPGAPAAVPIITKTMKRTGRSSGSTRPITEFFKLAPQLTAALATAAAATAAVHKEDIMPAAPTSPRARPEAPRAAPLPPLPPQSVQPAPEPNHHTNTQQEQDSQGPQQDKTSATTPPAPTTKPAPNTLSILHYTAQGGLKPAMCDVQMLLAKHQPDVVSLADANLTKGQRRSTWLHNALDGYKVWTAHPDPVSGISKVVLGIKEHIAMRGQATQLQSKGTQGRLAQVTLKLPHSKALTLSAVYAPAGAEETDMTLRESIYASIEGSLGPANIIMGDFNAALLDSDRDSKQLSPKDKAHQTFAKRNALHALDEDKPAREHSWSRTNIKDGSTTTTRIDDILINRPVPNGTTTTIVKEGTQSDHHPLLCRIPTATLEVHIPARRPPGPPPPPKIKLMTPLTQEDRIALQTRLASHSDGIASATAALHADLTHILTTEVQPYFAEIAKEDGKTPNRLGTISGEPAMAQVTYLADRATALLESAHCIARQLCRTKTTTPGGRHFRKRTEEKKRTHLRKQVQSLRAIRSEASALGTPEHQIADVIAAHDRDRTLPAPLSSCWDETQAKHAGRDLNTIQLLTLAEREKKAEIRKADKEHAKQNIEAAATRQRRLIYSHPKQANRQIFQKGAQQSRHKALLDPNTNEVTDDPEQMLGVITKHFQTFQSAPHGPKQGLYLPKDVSRKDQPWQQPGAADPFKLETPASKLAARPWLHDIISDRAVFSECVRTLSNGKTPGPDGMINEIIKLLPAAALECIHSLFIIMWATGITPNSWKESHTALLFKDKPDAQETNLKHYRPVALLNALYKLWTRLKTTALTDYAERYSILSSTQRGFRKHATTMYQLQMLTMALEDARLTGQNLYLLSVDFSSAFNMIDHDKLLMIMYDLGFPTDAIDVVKDLYTGATTSVKWDSGITKPIPIERGSIQGDTLSPFLFLVYVEPLLRWLHVGARGYKFGSFDDGPSRVANCLSSCTYADDLNAPTNSLSDLKLQAEKVSLYSDWASMPVNTTKTICTGILYSNVASGLYGSRNATTAVRRQLEGHILIQGQPVSYKEPTEPPHWGWS